MQDLIARAEMLLDALPYIQKFSGATFVIKYGGSFMDSPAVAIRQGVARDIVCLEAVEINPVVVHGGGKAISRAMENSGLKPQFIQGQRVTDQATAEIVDRVLSREINPEVVGAIKSMGGAAKGFNGPSIFKCSKTSVTSPDGHPLDMGFVGEVTEVNVNPLLECIAQGVTPVISPTARGADGMIYNCNADVAAAQTAIALNARRLIFMSDVPGVLRNPADPTSAISHLRLSEVDQLRQTGVVDKGMIPKISSAVAAVKSGVEKVSLVDGRVPHAVLLEIFTDAGIGTEVVQ